MRKALLISVIILLLGQVYAVSEEDLSKSVFDLIDDGSSDYNRFIEKGGLPSQLSFLTSARVNLYVGEETVGIVIEGGKIAEVVKGGIDDPTNEFKMSREYFNSILTSEMPLKRFNFGLTHAFIVKRDLGIGGRSKGKLLERAVDKFDVPEPKVERKVEKLMGQLAEKKEDKLVVEGEKVGLKKTDLEMKTEEDVSGKTVTIEEYTGYVDEAPPGTKILTTKEGEGSLGTYVKIETPDLKVDELVLKIGYSDEDLDYKFLDENSLAIKWLDENTGQWVELKPGSPDWVDEVGVNKDENYVFVKGKHASVYGVAGTIIDVKKIEEQRGIQPVYFESIEEVERIRTGATKRGIVDRIIDFVLGIFIK